MPVLVRMVKPSLYYMRPSRHCPRYSTDVPPTNSPQGDRGLDLCSRGKKEQKSKDSEGVPFCDWTCAHCSDFWSEVFVKTLGVAARRPPHPAGPFNTHASSLPAEETRTRHARQLQAPVYHGCSLPVPLFLHVQRRGNGVKGMEPPTTCNQRSDCLPLHHLPSLLCISSSRTDEENTDSDSNDDVAGSRYHAFREADAAARHHPSKAPFADPGMRAPAVGRG